MPLCVRVCVCTQMPCAYFPCIDKDVCQKAVCTRKKENKERHIFPTGNFMSAVSPVHTFYSGSPPQDSYCKTVIISLQNTWLRMN